MRTRIPGACLWLDAGAAFCLLARVSWMIRWQGCTVRMSVGPQVLASGSMQVCILTFHADGVDTSLLVPRCWQLAGRWSCVSPPRAIAVDAFLAVPRCLHLAGCWPHFARDFGGPQMLASDWTLELRFTYSLR